MSGVAAYREFWSEFIPERTRVVAWSGLETVMMEQGFVGCGQVDYGDTHLGDHDS